MDINEIAHTITRGYRIVNYSRPRITAGRGYTYHQSIRLSGKAVRVYWIFHGIQLARSVHRSHLMTTDTERGRLFEVSIVGRQLNTATHTYRNDV